MPRYPFLSKYSLYIQRYSFAELESLPTMETVKQMKIKEIAERIEHSIIEENKLLERIVSLIQRYIMNPSSPLTNSEKSLFLPISNPEAQEENLQIELKLSSPVIALSKDPKEEIKAIKSNGSMEEELNTNINTNENIYTNRNNFQEYELVGTIRQEPKNRTHHSQIKWVEYEETHIIQQRDDFEEPEISMDPIYIQLSNKSSLLEKENTSSDNLIISEENTNKYKSNINEDVQIPLTSTNFIQEISDLISPLDSTDGGQQTDPLTQENEKIPQFSIKKKKNKQKKKKKKKSKNRENFILDSVLEDIVTTFYPIENVNLRTSNVGSDENNISEIKMSEYEQKCMDIKSSVIHSMPICTILMNMYLRNAQLQKENIENNLNIHDLRIKLTGMNIYIYIYINRARSRCRESK